jgi:integrase
VGRLLLDCLDAYPGGTPRLRLAAGKALRERTVPVHDEAAQAIRDLVKLREAQPDQGIFDPDLGRTVRYLFLRNGVLAHPDYLFASPLARICGELAILNGDGVPLLPSERKNADGTASRIGDETLRSALARAAGTHLPDWPDVVTPHVLRHFCASGLYLGGMDLIAIQATLGHAWIAMTVQYVHVPGTHIEDAWIAGQQRAAARLKGLLR